MIRVDRKRIVLLALLVGVGCRGPGGVETVTTQGQEQAWFGAAVSNRLVTVTRTDHGVQIRSTGRYVKSSPPRRALTNDFVLTVGDDFAMAPDDHASAHFVLREITPTGIAVDYTSTFDHRSFGRNLITTDRGTFFWSYPAGD